MIYPALKRGLDAGVAMAAIVLLSPLFLLIALLVRFSSPGPVFFRQERVGRFGRSFEVLKFRSMRVTADGPALTASGDSRITPVGRLLRRSKMDELPQLLNVVKGDMSLVGPRPEVAQYVAYYPDDVRATVLSVRPGITDLASIQFVDEEAILASCNDPHEAYVNEILPRKLRFYQDYVEQQSFILDLKILLATILAIIRPRRTA